MASVRQLVARQRGNPTSATLLVLVVLIVIFSFTSSRFLTWDNFLNVTRASSTVIIVACAVTLVMIARGLDLSVGSVLAVCTVASAKLASTGTPLEIAYVAALLVGLAFGLLNAFFIVGLRVSPIIATLGTLNIARGAAFLIAPSAILVGLPSNWADLGTGYLFAAIPYPIIIAAVVAVVFWVLLNYTVFGRNVYAVGGNEEAARIAGVNVPRMYIILYSLSGLATGLGAIVLGSRLGAGDPNIGVGFEFDVIVAVILGGTSLAGGEGRISGTVLGALIVAVLSNGLNLAGVDPFWQYVAKGLALVVAVVIDRIARTEREAKETQAPTASANGSAAGA
jgi:ribose/xylose/arabinose/galactoside ABC-type transport system permease subunit